MSGRSGGGGDSLPESERRYSQEELEFLVGEGQKRQNQLSREDIIDTGKQVYIDEGIMKQVVMDYDDGKLNPLGREGNLESIATTSEGEKSNVEDSSFLKNVEEAAVGLLITQVRAPLTFPTHVRKVYEYVSKTGSEESSLVQLSLTALGVAFTTLPSFIFYNTAYNALLVSNPQAAEYFVGFQAMTNLVSLAYEGVRGIVKVVKKANEKKSERLDKPYNSY